MTSEHGPAARMGKLVLRPAVYAGWAAIVVLGLVATYLGDPYLFGFVTLAAGGATLAIALVGLMVVIAQREIPPRARIAILFWVTVAGGAVLLALRRLSTFSWT